MRFPELLIEAIRRSEIPLRFEPGAEDAVAKPVTDLLRAWLSAHRSGRPETDALVSQLLSEVDGQADLPG